MQKKNQRTLQESNLGRRGLQPPALPTELRIRRRGGRPALGWNQSQTNRPPGCNTLATVDLSVSRRRYAFGFMVHYNILKTDNRTNRTNFTTAFIKVSKFFFNLSGVAFLPIRIATCSHVIFLEHPVPDNPLHSGRNCIEPCFHLTLDLLCVPDPLLQ